MQFHAKTSEFFREKVEFPFFQFHLKGQGERVHPEAWVFETSTNQLRRHERWPPDKARPAAMFLHGGGRLSADPPPAEAAPGYDEYVSDPAKPVPFIDWTDIGMPVEYMVADQLFAARRTDVPVYQTDVLKQDLTLVGPVEVDLHVATSGTDSDWVVKLIIDVYPPDLPDPAENPSSP